jgi:hypothetical protein
MMRVDVANDSMPLVIYTSSSDRCLLLYLTERKASNSAKHEIPAPVYSATPTHINHENPTKTTGSECKKKEKKNTRQSDNMDARLNNIMRGQSRIGDLTV